MKTREHDSTAFEHSLKGVSVRQLLDQEAGLRLAIADARKRINLVLAEIEPQHREIDALRDQIHEQEFQLRDLHHIIDRAYEEGPR